jgi:hypothetical protein
MILGDFQGAVVAIKIIMEMTVVQVLLQHILNHTLGFYFRPAKSSLA